MSAFHQRAPRSAAPFLVGNKCRIHEAKPAVCAMFPLGRAHGFDLETESRYRRSFTFLINRTAGMVPKHTPYGNGWAVSTSLWMIPSTWSGALPWFPSPRRSGSWEEIHPAATMMLIRPAVYEHLYLAYNTSKDFLPQFQENLKKTKEFFQALLAAVED